MPETLLDDFTLEPSPKATGLPSEAIIAELRSRRQSAKAIATDYADAVRAVAEQHKLKPGALKRYIAALEDDKLQDVEDELHDLESLIDKET